MAVDGCRNISIALSQSAAVDYTSSIDFLVELRSNVRVNVDAKVVEMDQTFILFECHSLS